MLFRGIDGNVLKLGALELRSPFILAPMESVTDCAYRRVCHDRGAALTWTEMIRAKGLARGDRSTAELIDTFDEEVPTGVQLLVANENELAGALKKLEALPQAKNVCAVDLNFGCPSPDAIRTGAGAAMLKRRAKLAAIFETLRAWQRATPLNILAVGAKVRLGLNRAEQDQQVYLPIVDLANQHLDYLTVHARHARADSTSPADWSHLTHAVQRATIPIVGNGDVLTGDDWQRMQTQTGVAGALIARGAIRSPWVFQELRGDLTAQHINEAEAQYRDLAERYGTRPKFLAWHAEGFKRMRARVAGREANLTLPPNEHMR